MSLSHLDAQLYNAPEFSGTSPADLPLTHLQTQLLCACEHSGVGPVGLPLSHLKTQLLVSMLPQVIFLQPWIDT